MTTNTPKTNLETNPTTTYEPHAIEQKHYQRWESQGYFNPSGQGPAYAMMLPPPNVTGSLHMGHGFGNTLMDILVRYHRMNGDNTLWQPGTDHAGIATQMVVERRLQANHETRLGLGREKFLEKVWAWKAESGGNITRQLRRLGASLAWERECFTLDPQIVEAVHAAFIRLFDDGLIYRSTRLVNWDPALLTAISDLEVINHDEEGSLWHIRYPLTDTTQFLVVATTRPETMLGDTAVAVHPNDERYRHLIGKHIALPLTERIIPIIADEYVDPLFGTGCVKITPAHDFNDYAMGERHHLPTMNIFTPDAHLNENVPAAYQGLERFAARKKIVEDLKTMGLLVKIDKHALKVPRGEKSGVVIEPYLTQQWFMKMSSLAAPAIAAVQQNDIRFFPENWNKTYFQWMNHIQDWCISRQLWWGHRIPVWYDANNKAYAGRNEQDVRTRYSLAQDVQLTQDEDVLDTWFSAGLWPFATLGWPNQTSQLKNFYPTNVLVTAFDIIFFWVARMIMLGLHFTGEVPFREIYITGLIRDAEGHKMSKSKGNVLDPIDLIDGISLDELMQKRTYGLMQPHMAEKIEKSTRKEFPQGIPSYGTDALRFTFCSLASYTREIRFDTQRLHGYRNFCNKLWNAARYVMINTEHHDCAFDEGSTNSPITLSLPDRYIIARLQQSIANAHAALAQYRFDLYAQAVYDFTWNEFCDWYLELSKPILNAKDAAPDILRGTRHTLLSVLETLLRLLHPVMPFITEELWQRLPAPINQKNKKTASIMLSAYPKDNPALIDEQALTTIEWLKNMITTLRSLRSEMNVPPGKPLSILLAKGTALDHEYVAAHQHFLTTLAKLATITWLGENEMPPESTSAFVGELEIFIPLAGLINVQEEKARLNREITKLKIDSEKIEKKLNNPAFIDKAPPDVISKDRARFEEINMTLAKLQDQLTKIT